MSNEKVFQMSFHKVYDCLIAKAERKGRSRQEVDEITCWLTGYSLQQLDQIYQKDMAYGPFFESAPEYNEKADLIKGSICGIKIDEISDPIMKRIRQLDKLVDELAKGKDIEKIKRK